jgi:hypothetical protein
MLAITTVGLDIATASGTLLAAAASEADLLVATRVTCGGKRSLLH